MLHENCFNPFPIFMLNKLKRLTKTRDGMKKNILKIVCLTFVLLLMQILQLSAQNQLKCYFDLKQYRFNADTSLVEVYYGILAAEKNKGPFVLEISVKKNEKQIVKNIWQIQNTTSLVDSNEQRPMIVDILRYLLIPGNYHVKLLAKDLSHPETVDSCEIKSFKIKNFDPQKTEISAIELAQKIAPIDPNNPGTFDKNRFNVFPNVIGIYDKKNPDVYYYVEIYNLPVNFSDQFYYIKRTMINGLGLPEAAVPIYTKKKRVRIDDVEVGMFSTTNLASGKYFLKLSVNDETDHEIVSANTSFYVHNPDVVPVNQSMLSFESQVAGSEIALLSMENLDLMVNATRLLVDQREQQIIDNLMTKEAKQGYLFRFWKAKDQNAETQTLEPFREFIQRVQYANSNFGQMKKQGWETDRGRILIIYGKPSEIQYYPNVPDFKEFQAWSYDNVESGVVFIFGVIGSFGDLSLVHSTKTGEIHNEAWIDQLKISEGQVMIGDASGVNQRQSVRDFFRRYNIEWPRYLK